MRWYYHGLIITGLTLFALFYYQAGLGAVIFLLATIYLSAILVKEVKRIKK